MPSGLRCQSMMCGAWPRSALLVAAALPVIHGHLLRLAAAPALDEEVAPMQKDFERDARPKHLDQALLRLRETPQGLVSFTDADPNVNTDVDDEIPATIDHRSIEGDEGLVSVHAIATYVVVPSTGVFLLTIIIGQVMVHFKYTRLIPENAWTVVVAVFLGLLVRHLLASGFISMHGYTVMNVSLLNLFFLPIIVFTSGWTLMRRDFYSQFQYILIYAVLGTMLSTVLIGSLVANVSPTLGYQLTMREAFLFAALISAVDPVSTLSVYSKLGLQSKQPLLNTLVFGESMINDAVAIVLFGIINEAPLESFSYVFCSCEVTRLLLGSMVFGCALASCLIFLLRIAKLPGHTRAEIIYVYVSAYFIFALSESYHFSGIISTLFAGIVFRRYGSHHLTEEGRLNLVEYLEHNGYLADSAVFLLCGASTALINSGRAFVFGMLSVVICLVVRAVCTILCSGLTNSLKHFYSDPHVVTWKHQLMLWHSGLRGGIALVLALEIDGTWCVHKGTIIDGTFVVICALLIFCGGTTEFLLLVLGLVDPEAVDADGEEVDPAFVKLEEEELDSSIIHRCMHAILVGSKDSATPGDSTFHLSTMTQSP